MKISILGIGYVGIHAVQNLANEKNEIVAFDINEEKIKKFNIGIDVTNEIGNDKINQLLTKKNVIFTTDEKEVENSDVFVVAVPTDAKQNGTILIEPLKKVSRIIGDRIKKGSIIVYESTVFPGLTEEICIPIIEKNSGKKVIEFFDVVYAPERVDPGNKINTVKNTPRIISGTSVESIKIIKNLYGTYIEKMVEVSSIKTAESIKILENTQRDLNIALMNDFAILMDNLNVNFSEVLSGAATKWNFIKFHPGFVGGHCIGIDPHYLIYKMDLENIDSTLIKTARNSNEQIINFVEKKIIASNPKKILYIGCTFKKNTNDIRNSKHIQLIGNLRKVCQTDIYDPVADVEKISNPVIDEYDTIVVGVKHSEGNYDFLNQIKEQRVFNLIMGLKISDNQWDLV